MDFFFWWLLWPFFALLHYRYHLNEIRINISTRRIKQKPNKNMFHSGARSFSRLWVHLFYVCVSFSAYAYTHVLIPLLYYFFFFLFVWIFLKFGFVCCACTVKDIRRWHQHTENEIKNSSWQMHRNNYNSQPNRSPNEAAAAAAVMAAMKNHRSFLHAIPVFIRMNYQR